MRKQLIIILSLILVLSVALTACGGKSDVPMTEDGKQILKVWSFTNELETMGDCL